MALPASGNSLSLNQLHVEAGGTSGTECSLNDADIRDIIGGSDGASQNINQYFGQSSESISFDEVITADNISSNSSQTLSFTGGVSDHDVIIVLNYNASGKSASQHSSDTSQSAYPMITSPGQGTGVDNTRHNLRMVDPYSMWFPHKEFWLLSVQTIVCGPNTANSFTWNPNDTETPTKNAQLVMIKYSTEAVQQVALVSYKQGGRNALGEYSSSIGRTNGQVVSGSQTMQVANANLHTNASVEGVIALVAKGGDRISDTYGGQSAFDMTFDTAGDVSAIIGSATGRPTTNYAGNATGHTYGLQYYAKKEDKPASGNYTDRTHDARGAGTYYGGGFVYANMFLQLRTDAP